jgi:hypothetical protein
MAYLLNQISPAVVGSGQILSNIDYLATIQGSKRERDTNDTKQE